MDDLEEKYESKINELETEIENLKREVDTLMESLEEANDDREGYVEALDEIKQIIKNVYY